MLATGWVRHLDISETDYGCCRLCNCDRIVHCYCHAKSVTPHVATLSSTNSNNTPSLVMQLQGNCRMVSGQVVPGDHVSVKAMLSQQKQKHLSAVHWSHMSLICWVTTERLLLFRLHVERSEDK